MDEPHIRQFPTSYELTNLLKAIPKNQLRFITMNDYRSTSKLSLEATFPPGYFLENLVALPDDTLLVTIANRKELYSLPPPAVKGVPRSAFLLERFEDDQWAFGIALAPRTPGIAYVLTTDFTSTGTRKSYLRYVDVSNVAAASRSMVVMQFPAEAKGLNGLVALSETVLLAADSFGGVIWRVDLQLDEAGRPCSGVASEWLRNPVLAGELNLPDFQPGCNGLKYSAACGALCFSSTQQRLLAKVAVDLDTLQAVGPITILCSGVQGDDLIIDDDYLNGPVAYLTTHRENSILRVPLIPPSTGFDPSSGSNVDVIAKGEPEDSLILGPSAGTWKQGEVIAAANTGRTAYFTCDGGLKNPLSHEAPRFARVVRLEL